MINPHVKYEETRRTSSRVTTSPISLEDYATSKGEKTTCHYPNAYYLLEEVKDSLPKNFKMKGLGELTYFLGIEALKFISGIILIQKKYDLELIFDGRLSG